MKVALFYLSFLPMILVASDQEASSSITPNITIFSLTAEEMVFASKLSDENRRRFCYQFSSKERLLCLQERENIKNGSYDEIVEKLGKTYK